MQLRCVALELPGPNKDMFSYCAGRTVRKCWNVEELAESSK